MTKQEKNKLIRICREIKARIKEYEDLIAVESDEKSKAYCGGVIHGLAIVLWMIEKMI